MSVSLVAVCMAYNFAIMAGCAYLVGWQGWSGWWFALALCLVMRPASKDE